MTKFVMFSGWPGDQILAGSGASGCVVKTFACYARGPNVAYLSQNQIGQELVGSVYYASIYIVTASADRD